jgi:hypothetical protein
VDLSVVAVDSGFQDKAVVRRFRKHSEGLLPILVTLLALMVAGYQDVASLLFACLLAGFLFVLFAS